MSKHTPKRPIGISRTGKVKRPENWTPGERGMAEAAVKNNTPAAPGVLRRQLAEMTAQRDELAEALEEFINATQGWADADAAVGNVTHRARAALKRAGR